MQKLLIADSSEIFTSALAEALRETFDICICTDGDEALRQLQAYRPDVLILNLMLPYMDGITMLQKSAFQPHIILAVTPYVNAYVERCVRELGIDFTMIAPSVKALTMRLQDLLQQDADLPDRRDLHTMTLYHLRKLNFSVHLDGYRQLCLALPLYAQDPQQLLTKELYPQIAHLCGSKDGRAVEHSIRKAIHNAWLHQDKSVWRKYFPAGDHGHSMCPTNKEFLCRLAELLHMQ